MKGVTGTYLLVLLIAIWVREATATRCYSCNDIETSEDCMNVTDCGNSEVCFARADGLSTGKVKFTIGCSLGLSAVRVDSTFCSELCTDNFCNLNKCNIPVSPKGKTERPSRCLSCDMMSDPTNCLNIVQCSQNDVCYIRELMVYGNKRYRLGCMNKHHCATRADEVTANPITVIGKRLADNSSSTMSPCSMCCENDHCNIIACDPNHDSSVVGPTHHLKLYDDNDTCRDTNTDACAAFGTLDSDACLTLPKVDQMCPKTCGICGHFGWSPWSKWSDCSHTCNDGTITRQRSCTHQISIANVHTCVGESTETNKCNNGICMIEGSWSSWESWGLCSQTCLNGTKTRVRQCESTDNREGGLYCPGHHSESTICNQIACPAETTCPDNWIIYHSACYFFGHTATTFRNAQSFCHARSASLVHIGSEQENTFIVNHIKTFSNPGNGWWIGMTDRDIEGTWKYTDTNTIVNYTKWAVGEPNNAGDDWHTGKGTHDNEDCCFLYQSFSFEMADIDCGLSANVLCERK